MQTFILLFIITFGDVGAVSGSEQQQEISSFRYGLSQRVVGGSETTIVNYPSSVVILEGSIERYLVQKCGGAIVNEKHVVTAAHCFRLGDTMSTKPDQYRVRVGATCAYTGGTLKEIENIILHPNWDKNTHDSDIAIIRLAVSFNYTYTKQPAVFANSDYHLPGNESLWATGWGFITERGPASKILRHVLVQSVSKDVCQERYEGFTITDNMICSGWLNIGGRDQCSRDSGSPLYHNGIVVGLSSLGVGCGNPGYPAINVRVSRFIDWVKSIAGNVRVSPPQKLKLVLRISLTISGF